jgi:hypothetical protein
MDEELKWKLHDEIVRKKLDELKEQARTSTWNPKPSPRRKSSLEEVIRTKEQAERFMMLLRWEESKAREKRLRDAPKDKAS